MIFSARFCVLLSMKIHDSRLAAMLAVLIFCNEVCLQFDVPQVMAILQQDYLQ